MKRASAMVLAAIIMILMNSFGLIQGLAGFAGSAVVAVEAKSLALAQELSQLLGHDQYVVLRKTKKLYMGENALWVDSNSITTIGDQRLWLDEHDLSLLQDKRVLFIDDVISTGKTKKVAEQLLNLTDAKIYCRRLCCYRR